MSEPSPKLAPRAALRESPSEEAAECADAPGVGGSSRRGLSAAEQVRATPRRRASDIADEELLTFSAVEEKLRIASRENECLKARNRQLAQALADAAQRGSAAHHLAYHDVLTGLPNRLLLLERLQDSISAAFQGHGQVALLFIDLDHFKYVNDRLGHAVGDKLLTIVASRILAAIRADDIACRYGGDEFVVLMSDIRDAALVASIADKLRERIDGSYGIDDNEVRISASIGFAVYPMHGDHCDALLSHADASMYRSKAARHDRLGLSSHNGSSEQDGISKVTAADVTSEPRGAYAASRSSQASSSSTARHRRR
jgi:diguanylate cyclase